MEHRLDRNQLSEERLPPDKSSSLLSMKTRSLHSIEPPQNNNEGDEGALLEKVETLLRGKIREGDETAVFQLGQLYFDSERYEEARSQFEEIADEDYQAQFQLGILHYDGLGTKADPKKGFQYMLNIANSTDQVASHLLPFARYNVGRAYFEGFGVQQSDREAEHWWLLAADDGNPLASVKAQTALGMYYSREDTLDLKKAFFWHSEATGNGSLESQGAMGVMYQTGQGIRRDLDSAFECLKEASERGNVYAMGHLVAHYYSNKMYTKAAELALRYFEEIAPIPPPSSHLYYGMMGSPRAVILCGAGRTAGEDQTIPCVGLIQTTLSPKEIWLTLLENIEEIKESTDCLPVFISKGIAMGHFYYARCLHLGLGVQKDKELAQAYYSKAFEFDGAVTQRLQDLVTHGVL